MQATAGAPGEGGIEGNLDPHKDPPYSYASGASFPPPQPQQHVMAVTAPQLQQQEPHPAGMLPHQEPSSGGVSNAGVKAELETHAAALPVQQAQPSPPMTSTAGVGSTGTLKSVYRGGSTGVALLCACAAGGSRPLGLPCVSLPAVDQVCTTTRPGTSGRPPSRSTARTCISAIS